MTEKSRKQMFCAVYTRKSVEDGLEQEFNSLDAQREAAENYIASQRDNGWTLLPKRYDDGGYSGGNTNRPALKELLADCASGLVDVVVVYKIDRLSRSIRDFAELSAKFDKWNVSFCSVTQDINTATSAGRMVLNILVTFAQYEREIIGERIRDKMRAMRRRGLWCGGNIPFGYRVEDHHLVPCPTEIPIVERIFNEFATAGRKVWQIVGELNADGIKTRRGFRWTKRNLLSILSNCAYIGKVGCKGEMFTGNHAPMISQEIWEAAQTLLPTEVKVRKPQERMPPPLNDLVICGHCGTPMHEYSIHKNGLNYYYYRCIGDSAENCPTKEIPAKRLEKLIWSFLGAGLHEPNVSVMYEAITGQKADGFLKWFDAISISALSRNYRNSKDERSQRVIEPHAIVFYDMQWSIKAFCPDKGKWLTFLISRIDRAYRQEERFAPSQKEIDAITPDNYYSFPSAGGVKIRLTRRGLQFAKSHPLRSTQSVTAKDMDTYILSVADISIEEMLRWTMSQVPGDAIPVEPQKMVDAFKDALDRMRSLCP